MNLPPARPAVHARATARMSLLLFGALVAVLAATGSASAQAIVQPSVIATDTAPLIDSDVHRIADQSGLTPPYVSGQSDFATYVASAVFDPFLNGEGAYHQFTPAVGGSFDFDLGGTVTIDRFALWQFPNNGGEIATLSLIADDEPSFAGATPLGSFSLTFDAGSTSIAQTFTFAPTDARYVRLTVDANHGFGTASVIGEVAFGGTPPPAVDPRSAYQVAGTLNIKWELISGPNPNLAGCSGIEITDGTLADAADGSITMMGTAVSRGGCFGLDNYSFTMAPDGLSLSGFASSVPMTLTRSPGDAAFAGYWIGQGYVFLAHIAADPFPIPDYDPSRLGTWVGHWTDPNDPGAYGSIELEVDVEQELNPGEWSFQGAMTWDCLFGAECGAVETVDGIMDGAGNISLTGTGLTDVENFFPASYLLQRTADGLRITGTALQYGTGREFVIELSRVAAFGVPSESSGIQSTVDRFADWPTALRVEVAPGAYDEKLDLASWTPRTLRSDLVGEGVSASDVILDDGVDVVGPAMVSTSGAGTSGLVVLDRISVRNGLSNSDRPNGAGLDVSGGSRFVAVKDCEFVGSELALATAISQYPGANAGVTANARARFERCRFALGRGVHGGGLTSPGGTVVVVDSVFEDNWSFSGGAVGHLAPFTGSLATLTGDAFYLRTEFLRNVADSSIGGVWLNSFGRIVFDGCTFADNVTGTAGQANSGAILGAYVRDFQVRDCVFVRNVSENGGAIMFAGAGTYRIENSVFGGADPADGNVGINLGGAIRIRYAEGFDPTPLNVEILDTQFRNNRSPFGGAIGLFTNAAFQTPGKPVNVLIERCTFDGNGATQVGGAIYASRSSADPGTLTIVDSDFTGNQSAFDAGAAYFYAAGPVTISGGRVADNVATGFGGGLWVGSLPIIVSGVDFTGNQANAGGALVLVDGAGSQVENSVFGSSIDGGNTVTSSGGAVFLQSGFAPSPSIERNVEARYPDELDAPLGQPTTDLSRAAVRRAGEVRFVQNTFESNDAAQGAGVYFVDVEGPFVDSIVFEGNTFDSNHADAGAGMYVFNRGRTFAVHNGVYRSNSADVEAAAVGIATGQVDFVNSLFHDNGVTALDPASAPWGGAALSIAAGDSTAPGVATLAQCTIAQNVVQSGFPQNGGGAILVAGSLELTNSIVFANTGPHPFVQLQQIRIIDLGTVVARHAIVEDASSFGPGPVLALDPLFVDPAQGDFRLSSGSPAIDAGDSALLPPGVTTDLDGNARLLGAEVDLGPYETDTVTAVPGNGVVSAPRDTGLLAPHPNPFNPSVNISFTVDRDMPVQLAIFDVRGRLVKVLVQDPIVAGEHVVTWGGTDASGRAVSSGVYVIDLRAGTTHDTQRITLVK